MTGKLTDKIAVVIGGSSGIAKRFAQEDAHVFYYRSPPIQLDAAVAAIGGDPGRYH